MIYRVRIADKAWNEIDQAYLWLKWRSPDAAERWKEKLFELVDSLRQFPERCPRAPESAAFGTKLRELRFGKQQGTYRIIFRIRGGTVYVLRVRHAARRGFDED
ncbi:MAG TPA: type II toxin-antitoxin system RelE/ParE family toxin [Pirellulales bacterium]|nr:type II toxin-antitoxin system RelE/ParE family toxin [Pirellulales bacterium]